MTLENISGIHGSVARGLESITTAHIGKYKERSPRELASTILNPQTAKRQKIASGVNLIGKIIPGFEEHLANIICAAGNKVPFDSDLEIISFEGGENYVFFMTPLPNNESGPKQKILKVAKASLGMNSEKLMEYVQRMKSEYKEVSEWYEDIPGFTVPEEIVILNSHLLRLPGVATVQDFVPGKFRGIFEDFRDGELVQTLNNNPTLREKFIIFGDRLFSVLQKEGKIIDLIGQRNVAIVENNGDRSLIHIDPHIIRTTEMIEQMAPGVAERYNVRFEMLQNTLAEIKNGK